MTELVRYDAMCHAIEAAYKVDEVKDIRDKAIALEHYARQAKNKEAMKQCGVIRIRAEKRAGELLAKMEKARGGGDQRSKHRLNGATGDRDTTLADLGITKTQSAQWQQLAALPWKEVEATLAQAKTVPSTNALLKKPRRAHRERNLAAKTKAASKAIGVQQYGVIYADPPWRFEPQSRETGMDRAADNHYPTMDTLAITQMSVPAAQNCVLFLWATAPMLPQALQVMQAWGFAYKSHCVWLKDKIGTGYWFRNKHELLLVGVRGDIPAPVMGEQYESVIALKPGEHSAKPNAFAEMIEELFPNVPKLEMFARSERLGWDVWGNQVK